MTATNVQRSTFCIVALALLMGVLAVSTSSSTAAPTVSIGSGTTKPVGITGGKTTLKPTKQMVRKLKRAKVRLMPTGSANGGPRRLVFPITGGRGLIDSQVLNPWLQARHNGSGFRIMKRVERTSPLAFRNPVIDSRDLMIWIGDVGNEVVMRFSETNLSQTQDGSIRFRAKLKLTKQSAKLLRKRLGLNVKKGTAFAVTYTTCSCTHL